MIEISYLCAHRPVPQALALHFSFPLRLGHDQSPQEYGSDHGHVPDHGPDPVDHSLGHDRAHVCPHACQVGCSRGSGAADCVSDGEATGLVDDSRDSRDQAQIAMKLMVEYVPTALQIVTQSEDIHFSIASVKGTTPYLYFQLVIPT